MVSYRRVYLNVTYNVLNFTPLTLTLYTSLYPVNRMRKITINQFKTPGCYYFISRVTVEYAFLGKVNPTQMTKYDHTGVILQKKVQMLPLKWF